MHWQDAVPIEPFQSTVEMRRKSGESALIVRQARQNASCKLTTSAGWKDIPILHIAETPSSSDVNLNRRRSIYHSCAIRGSSLSNTVRPELFDIHDNRRSRIFIESGKAFFQVCREPALAVLAVKDAKARLTVSSAAAFLAQSKRLCECTASARIGHIAGFERFAKQCFG